jgi:hypothetical protein
MSLVFLRMNTHIIRYPLVLLLCHRNNNSNFHCQEGGEMRKIITLVITVAALISIFSGCGNSQKAENTAKQFLEAFYTIANPEDALKDIAIIDEKDEPEAFVDLKKEKFQKYFSDDAFLVFLVSPEWMSIYTQSAVQGLTLEPRDITLEKAAGESYKFSLDVIVTEVETGESRQIPQRGELVVTDNGKISDFTFDNLGDF